MLRRLLQLFIGLTLYGVSTAMFVRADLGADPLERFSSGGGKSVVDEHRLGDYCRGRIGPVGMDPTTPASGVWHIK